jgi:hypothetical protein
MTKTVLTTIFVLTFVTLFGQVADNTNKRDESNIYNQSIIQYFNYLKIEKSKTSDTIFFMEDELGLTKRLISRIGNTQLISINESEIAKLVIKSKSLTVYKIFPLEYENQEFHVSIVPYGVTYKNDETGLLFVTYGGCWINFKFENEKFKFIRIQINEI